MAGRADRGPGTDARIGIVSPVSDHCGPGPQLVSGPRGASNHQRLIEEPRRLFFFCVMIRRELWESLRGLDEIYQLGTYEDDDFCLRARLAGWLLAVDPNVFVFNHASKTFEENRIDHDEWLFRNEKVFLERASCLSRLLHPATPAKRAVPSTSVIVAVPEATAGGLIDSLTSLANETVAGFETVIVSMDKQELPGISTELERTLQIRRVTVPGNAQAGSGSLWNAGLARSRGVSRVSARGRYLFSLSPRNPSSVAFGEQVPGSVYRLERVHPFPDKSIARRDQGI